MASLERLPLFPLNTVLFPYAQILVRVFEDRYRKMVSECLTEEQSFGIVLIRSGSEVGPELADPYLVGTAVHVLGQEELPDGALQLRVRGERRFRIRRIDDSGDWLVGQVEPVVELDLDDCPRMDALAMRAREDFERWVQIQISRQGLGVQIRFPEDQTALSFAIANFLPITNLEKQQLLEITDTAERFAGLIPLLERQILEADTGLMCRLRASDLAGWMSPN